MIDFDFNEKPNWTKTRVVTVDDLDADPDRRCERCPSIAEKRFVIDLINSGEKTELILCPACVAEYTRDFDERNIFRGSRERQ